MHCFEHECERLAARARGGDAGALAGLRQKLEPQMPLLVRRVLHSGRAATPFERQVQRTAHQVRQYAGPAAGADADRLVRRVSTCVLDGLLAGLGAPPTTNLGMKDTVRM